jgi:hypothetical protein
MMGAAVGRKAMKQLGIAAIANAMLIPSTQPPPRGAGTRRKSKPPQQTEL